MKAFTLSLVETAIEVTEGAIPGRDLQAVLDLGKVLLDHPVAAPRRRARGGRRPHRPLPRDGHHQGRPAPPGDRRSPGPGWPSCSGGSRSSRRRTRPPTSACSSATRIDPATLRHGRQLRAQRRAPGAGHRRPRRARAVPRHLGARARRARSRRCTTSRCSSSLADLPACIAALDRGLSVPELTIVSYNIHWGRGSSAPGYPPFDVVDAVPTTRCRRARAAGVVGARRRAVRPRVGSRTPSAWSWPAMPAWPVRCSSPSRSGASARPTPRGGIGELAPRRTVPRAGRRHRASCRSRTSGSTRRPRRAGLRRRMVDGSPLHVRGTHLPHLEYGAHLSTRGLRRALPPTDRARCLHRRHEHVGLDDRPHDAQRAGAGWCGARPGRSYRPHSQIDHLLVTPSVEVVWSEVCADLGSDHLPIRARSARGA